MLSKSKGSIRLFHALGVDVFLHWSWFLVAAYEIQSRSGRYSSVVWNALEYLSLFLIVLLHEFGHAMACRQVGGTANRIILWPMGGVAFVNPPQRAGATLWSIAAGPLVNVALLPALIFATWMSRRLGWMISHHDLYVLLRHILGIDIVLLLFNMLPVFPLDGGQILRSLLWFVMGRGRSLNGGGGAGLRRRPGICGAGRLDAIGLDWRRGGVHGGELLERIQGCPGADAAR
jgi:Zn-dependent protease